MISGLLLIIPTDSARKILDFTGQATDLNCYRRYVKTLLNTLLWFQREIKPGTEAWKSIETVRKIHTSVNYRTGHNPIRFYGTDNFVAKADWSLCR